MDSFDDEHTVGNEFQTLSVVFSFSCNEIIFRHFHHFSIHQTSEMVFEQFVIYCFDIIEIVISIWKEWCIDTIHKIIICGERNRAQSTSQKLNGESLAEGCFSRAGRTCDENDTNWIFRCMVSSVYLLCNLNDFLFLQCLAHLDKLGSISIQNRFVHISCIRMAHDDIPVDFFCKHGEGLWHIDFLCQLIRILDVGYPKQHTSVVELQSPYLDIACRWNERTIEIIHRVT